MNTFKQEDTFTEVPNVEILDIGKKYLVKEIATINTRHGERILVVCNNKITFVLPISWNHNITYIKQQLEYDEPLYVIYNGRKSIQNNMFIFDIIFVRDDEI